MDPFLGEIRQFGFGITPRGWAACNGQLLPINQNQALFALLGTTYGGNGNTTFGLPNLQGRVAIHQTSGYNMGQRGGEETHTLTTQEMPQHTHQMLAFDGAADTGATATPPGPSAAMAQAYAVPTGGGQTAITRYSTATATGSMASQELSTAGNSFAHENRQPFLTTNMCIATSGIFPSRS